MSLSPSSSDAPAASPAAPPAGSPESDGAAHRLLQAHAEVIGGKGSGQAGKTRGPYAKRSEPGGSAARPAAPGGLAPAAAQLPPGTALPEVMGSGAALFFNLHATLLDDPEWNLNDTAKKEMGNILSWMLCDDFYKLGGIGKYVVGGILCLSMYAVKASATAPKRKARKNEARLRLERESAALRSAQGQPVIKETAKNESMAQREIPRFLADPSPKS